MTIHEATHELLGEIGRPVSARELARIALERGMVRSNAKDPILSLAQTIEKNIRDETYNQPRLVFVKAAEGRLIGLPRWGSQPAPGNANETQNPRRELRVSLRSEVMDQLELAVQARMGRSLEETVEYLLRMGLTAARTEIKSSLMRQLDTLGVTP